MDVKIILFPRDNKCNLANIVIFICARVVKSVLKQMLVISNKCPPPMLFKPLLSGLLNLTTKCCILMHLKHIAMENIVRKGVFACNKQFLLFSQCFLSYMVLIFHLKCTLKCCLQFVSIWTSLKFCCLIMG